MYLKPSAVLAHLFLSSPIPDTPYYNDEENVLIREKAMRS